LPNMLKASSSFVTWEKVCLRKHEIFLFPFFFTDFCDGSGGKIQVTALVPDTEQNHCLEVRGEGCNS